MLHVFKGAPVFTKLPEPLGQVKKDETVKLECLVEGLPKPNVSWYVLHMHSLFLDYFFIEFSFRLLNGKELSVKDGVQIEKDVNAGRYTLTIPKVNPSIHSGTIIIKATNTIGSVEHEILLNVFGKYIFCLLIFSFIFSRLFSIELVNIEEFV